MTDLTVHNAAYLHRIPGMPVRRAPRDGRTGGLGDIVMPDMINPHALLPMTLFHGPGEDMDDRLFRYLLPAERKFVTPRMIHTRTTPAAWESIRTDVTAFADMYYTRPKWARSSTPQTNIGRKKTL